MLSSASTYRSDPRVMAGLIASSSLKLIDRRNEPSSHVFEATLVRLLETYRHDAFRHGKPRAILARTTTRHEQAHSGRDLSLDVRDAIARAHKEMFPKLSRDAFCDKIESDVRACFGAVDEVPGLAKHKIQLRRFLRLVRDNLSQ